MRYDDIVQILLEGAPEHWLWNDERGIWTFKPDVSLTVRELRQDNPKPFREPWTEAFADSKAVRCVIEVYYGAAFVQAFLFVAVDGGRAILPCPRSRTDLSISRLQRGIADILNLAGDVDGSYYDRYIARFRTE